MHSLCRSPRQRSEAASGASPLCPSQLISAPSLCHSPPVWRPTPGQVGPAWTLCAYLCCRGRCQRSGRLLGQRLTEHQQWPPTPRLHSGTGSPCVPLLSLFPSPGCPRSSAMLRRGMREARAFAWLGLRHTARWSQKQPLEQTSLHPASGVSQSAHASQVGSRLPTALLSVPVVLQPAKGACLPQVGPQDLGVRSVA